MPSKKKKYNARFPPARIKKIMQSDEEVGKVAQAVPVIISRALELFVESLLKKAETVTQGRNAKTLTPSHLKQCIMAEQRFDFLKDVVASIPDVQGDEDVETPRSAVSNSAFVFPTSTATSSSSTSSSSAPQTPTSAPPQHPEPTTPSYASSLPDQKPPTYPGVGMHQLPMSVPQPHYPPRSHQSTMNSSVPVIVPNPSVNYHQQHPPMMSPYIPTSTPEGQYAMYPHQHPNPNGLGMGYGGGGSESMLSYGVQRADGSHPNPPMHGSMYDHKNSPYQYHHHQQHPNQYHSQ